MVPLSAKGMHSYSDPHTDDEGDLLRIASKSAPRGSLSFYSTQAPAWSVTSIGRFMLQLP